LDWQDSYSVHIAQMDRQHQKIARILDRIYYLEAGDRRSLDQVFNALSGYMLHHFADEEGLLRAHGYPGYEEQRREHEDFLGRMRRYQEQFQAGALPVMINMFNDVWDWFAKHVVGLDKQYEPFLKARGCR